MTMPSAPADIWINTEGPPVALTEILVPVC